MRTRAELLAMIDALIIVLGRLNTESGHVLYLIKRYKGYYEFRGQKRLDKIHKEFSKVSKSIDELWRELEELPYKIQAVAKNDGQKFSICRGGFESEEAAKEFIKTTEPNYKFKHFNILITN